MAGHATSKTAVGELLRIAWRTVGSIVIRVVAESRAAGDPFDGLRRIGIDEISHKKGHRYLMVVVDHDTRRLVWAAPGHDKATLAGFFDALGPERCARMNLPALLHALSLPEWRQHPLRHATALLAVALGVALAFAVHLINASALAEFGAALRAVEGRADLELRGPAAGFDEALYARAARTPGVAAASPLIEIDTYALDAAGMLASEAGALHDE